MDPESPALQRFLHARSRPRGGRPLPRHGDVCARRGASERAKLYTIWTEIMKRDVRHYIMLSGRRQRGALAAAGFQQM